jgi:hypothetical protein
MTDNFFIKLIGTEIGWRDILYKNDRFLAWPLYSCKIDIENNSQCKRSCFLKNIMFTKGKKMFAPLFGAFSAF